MKRICLIALALMMCINLGACQSAEPTPTPPATVQETVTPSVTTSPAVSTPTPTSAPTSTPITEQFPLPTVEDFPNYTDAKALEGAKLYKLPFETWPLEDDGVWNANAFFTINLEIDPSNADFIKNAAKDNSFTWQIFVEIGDKITGPFETELVDVLSKEGGKTVYRFSFGDLAGGELAKMLEPNKEYVFFIALNKDNENQGFVKINYTFDEGDNSYKRLYMSYWARHDRSEGYTSGSHPVTEKDKDIATYIGFSEWWGKGIYDRWDQFFTTAHFYGRAFETWPFEDNGKWAPRAFLKTNVIISRDEGDFRSGIGTEDYPYTWKIYYDYSDGATFETMKGPYTTPVFYCYSFDNDPKVIYYLSISDAPEGDFTKDLEVGEEYLFFIQIRKGDALVGYMPIISKWEEIYDAYSDVYTSYWQRHDRSLGITSGIHTVTDEDIADALKYGFDKYGNFTGRID